jgi:group I intron endonuclease
MVHYIYCITNKTNNKSYVGQTNDIEGRWYNHKINAEKQYIGKVFAFQSALKKYGSDNFTWQIIETHETLDLDWFNEIILYDQNWNT